MDTSVFMDQGIIPGNDDLKRVLNNTYDLWNSICEFVHEVTPHATEEWKFSGKKFGWSFRINDKKRVLVYLLPREGYFKVAFVFGQKATDAILASSIAENIREELQSAKVYAEGRGIRMDVREIADLSDIKHMVTIKLAN